MSAVENRQSMVAIVSERGHQAHLTLAPASTHSRRCGIPLDTVVTARVYFPCVIRALSCFVYEGESCTLPINMPFFTK